MKSCPKCSRAYTDETLNFCLEDGEWLVAESESNEPQTAVLPDDGRTRTRSFEEKDTRVYTSGAFVSKEFQKHKFRGVLIVGSIAVVLAGFAYGLFRFLTDKPTAAPERTTSNLKTQRLTGDGKTRGAIISPDGKLVAYIRVEGAERSIWIKQIATNTAIQLVKPGNLDLYENLSFSPDGIFLYFNAEPDSDDPPSIYRVSSLGGTPTRVLTDAMSVEFSPDGRQLSFGRYDFAKTEVSFFVANLDGSDERKIVSRLGKQYFEPEHAWSPDGRFIVTIFGDDAIVPDPSESLLVVPISGGEPVAIGERWGVIDDVVWHPSGDSLLVTAREATSNQNQVWEVAYPGGGRRRLTNDLNGYNSVSITADGKSIVTGEIYSRSALWVSPDLKPENAKQIMPATADTFGFSWTPDDRLVFASSQSGDAEIWIIDADGSNAKQLTNDRILKTVPVVSPDGKYIVYASAANGGEITRIDADGSNRLAYKTPTGADNPDISSDGKWVLFSAYNDGQHRIMRVPLEGGEVQILTDYRANEPRYSRDGTRFACFMPNETTVFWTKVAIVSAEGGKPIAVFDAPQATNNGRGPMWTPDDSGITVVIAEGEKQNLWLLPVNGSPGKRMTNFDVPGVARREYSRDGKRIALVRAEGIGNAIMITDFR